MDNADGGWRRVPLVRKVRMAMDPGNRFETSPRFRQANVRRDVAGLLNRLETLRQRFPNAPDLLDRVRLSPHVIHLLMEARGIPELAEGRRPS